MSANKDTQRRPRNKNKETQKMISELLQPDNEYLHTIMGDDCISSTATTTKRRHGTSSRQAPGATRTASVCGLSEPKYARRSRSYYNEAANRNDIILNIEDILDTRDWKYMYTTSFSDYTYRVIRLALQFIQIHSFAALIQYENSSDTTNGSTSRANSRRRKDFPLKDPFYPIFLQFKDMRNKQLRFRSSRHIILNAKDKSFTCRVCHLVYPSVQEYKRHFIRSHVNIRCLSDRDITTCQMPMTTIRSRLLRTFFGYERYVNDRVAVAKGTLTYNENKSYPSKKQIEKWKLNVISEVDDESHNYIDDALYWCKNCNCLFDFREDLSNHMALKDHLTDTINEAITRYQKFTFPILPENIKRKVEKQIPPLEFRVPQTSDMFIPDGIAPHLKYENNSTTITTKRTTSTRATTKNVSNETETKTIGSSRTLGQRPPIPSAAGPGPSTLAKQKNLPSSTKPIVEDKDKRWTRSSLRKDEELINRKRKELLEAEAVKQKHRDMMTQKKLVKPKKLLKNILSKNVELGKLLRQFRSADIDNMMNIRQKILEEIEKNNQKSSRAKLIAFAKKCEAAEKLRFEEEAAAAAAEAARTKKKSTKKERNGRGRAAPRDISEAAEYQFNCPNCGSKFRDTRTFQRHEKNCQKVAEVPFRHNPDHPYMTHHRNQYGDRLRNLKNGKNNRRGSLLPIQRANPRRQPRHHVRDSFYDVEFVNRCNADNQFELWEKLGKKIKHQFYLHMGVRLNAQSCINRMERQPFASGMKEQQILKIDPIYKKLFARLFYHIFHFDDHLHGKEKSSKLLLADLELMNSALTLFHFMFKPHRKGRPFTLFEKKLSEMKEKDKEREEAKANPNTQKKLDEERMNLSQLFSDARSSDNHYSRMYGKITSDELEMELNRILSEFQTNCFTMKNFLLIVDSFFEDCFSLDSFPRTMRNRYRLGFPSNNYSPFYSTVQTYETHHVPMMNGPRVHGTHRSLALIATKLNEEVSATSEFLHVSSVDCSFVRHGFLGNKPMKENALPLMESKYFIGTEMDIKHQKKFNRYQGQIYCKPFGCSVNYNKIGMCMKNAPDFQAHLLATMFHAFPPQTGIDEIFRFRNLSKAKENVKQIKFEKQQVDHVADGEKPSETDDEKMEEGNLDKNKDDDLEKNVDTEMTEGDEKETTKIEETEDVPLVQTRKISTRLVTSDQIRIMENVLQHTRVLPTIPQIPAIEEDEITISDSNEYSLEKSEIEEMDVDQEKIKEVPITDDDGKDDDEEEENDVNEFADSEDEFDKHLPREERLEKTMEMEIKQKLFDIIRRYYGNRKIRFNAKTLNQISRLAMTEHFLYVLLNKTNKECRILWNCHSRSFVDITNEFKPLVFDVVQLISTKNCRRYRN